MVAEIGQALAADVDTVAVADHMVRVHRTGYSLVGPDIVARLWDIHGRNVGVI